jgi:twitching motility two-component system response regulator PilH
MAIRSILVVEDSPTDQKYLTDILVRKGYDVSTAESGEEAIAKARQLQPDLVLMDIVLPGQNGYQATRELSKDARTKHIPVIICSTKSQETDRVWGLRQGARDYIVKPVSQADLLAKIAALG